MKKLFKMSLMAIVCVMCGVSTVSATSWRVNNNTAMGAHFVDVNAAMTDERVAEGDTLYLDPSTIFTTRQTISKRVTIVGPGYFHQESSIGSATFNDVSIEKNAAGTKIEGCVFRGTGLSYDYVRVYADNVTFERNYFCKQKVAASSSKYLVFHANYFETNYEAFYGSGASTYGWVITNNIIKSGLQGNSIGGIPVKNLDNATIQNNVIINHDGGNCCIYQVYNSTITNNILINASKAVNGHAHSPLENNNIIEKNVTSSSADYSTWPNFPNNTFLGSNDLTAVFDTNGIADCYYRLCEGSPAKGAGVGGSDCGAYAGDSYVPSGLPLFYPYFTGVEIPAVTTDGKLNIKLNIKAQNE